MRVTSILVLAGCFHEYYRAGSFDDLKPWPGEHVSLPCLDVAVAIGRDPAVTGPVVQYMFGNRCDHDVIVDIPAVQVTARTRAGRELHLVAYDPRGEIHADALPALITGAERIEYNGDFAEQPLAQVCVDIGAIDRTAPTGKWVCR